MSIALPFGEMAVPGSRNDWRLGLAMYLSGRAEKHARPGEAIADGGASWGSFQTYLSELGYAKNVPPPPPPNNLRPLLEQLGIQFDPGRQGAGEYRIDLNVKPQPSRSSAAAGLANIETIALHNFIASVVHRKSDDPLHAGLAR